MSIKSIPLEPHFYIEKLGFSGVYLHTFLIFAPKHRLWVLVRTTGEAVLTSTHNLCFGAKIRKIGILLHTPVLLYKNGVQGGKHYTDMFS